MVDRLAASYRLYFDAAVCISAANRDGMVPDDFLDIIEELTNAGRAKIIVSGRHSIEILPKKTPGDLTQVMELLTNPAINIRARNNRASRRECDVLMDAAAKYNKRKSKGKRSTMLREGDAEHLQAALANKARELHTTDKQLLGLAPEVTAGSNLRILKPQDSPIYNCHKVVRQFTKRSAANAKSGKHFFMPSEMGAEFQRQYSKRSKTGAVSQLQYSKQPKTGAAPSRQSSEQEEARAEALRWLSRPPRPAELPSDLPFEDMLIASLRNDISQGYKGIIAISAG